MNSFTKRIILVLIIFISVELGLRFMGYVPYKPPTPSEARFIKPDSLRGWVHVPGEYEFTVNTWGDVMNLIIDENGERVTKTESTQVVREEILLIGGSFTMGIGLDDDETFAWKLQERFPSVDFRNLGVGAYSTYQSLLVLEDKLKNKHKPKAVVYGFIDHHMVRNVSESDWLYSLQAAGEQSEMKLLLPFVSLDKNESLKRHKSVELIRVPFSSQLSTSFMIQRVINHIFERNRVSQAGKVLELLLLEIQKLCTKHDITFYVGILACDGLLMSDLTSFFEQKNIAYIDCNVPLNKDNTFRDDGHPKEIVNEEWAKRIGSRLHEDGVVNTNFIQDR